MRLIRSFTVFSLVLTFSLFSVFAKEKIPQTAKELREALFQQKGIYFAKGNKTSDDDYLKTLKGLYKTDDDLKVKDGIVTVGEQFILMPTLHIGPDGPEYSNDNLMAIGLDIEVEAKAPITKVVKFLKSLEIEAGLANFIKANFTKSRKYIERYGHDFYLATLLATIRKYYGFPRVIDEIIEALGKHPDKRLIAFIRDFRKEYNLDPDSLQKLEVFTNTTINKTVLNEVYGRPYSCEGLEHLAQAIAFENEEDTVKAALRKLAKRECKESISYLFFINNLSYVNEGDNLFDNEAYFSWDKKNFRYSLDLQQKEKFKDEIANAYRIILFKIGITLTEALRLIADRYQKISVGADSIFFEYLFRIPYKDEWELTAKELFSLVNNSLYAGSGYWLKEEAKIYKISKTR